MDAVLAEGLQHHLFLGRVLGKVEVMTGLVVLTVVDIVLLIAGLAFYLFWVGTLLTRIAANLEECGQIVRDDRGPRRADRARRGAHQRRPAAWWPARCRCCTGWPRSIVTGVDLRARRAAGASAERARPASGRRRSRLHDAVGFTPPR